MKASPWILVILATLAFAGCNSAEYRIKKYPDRFAALSPEEQTAIQNKTLDIGQSAEVVYFILGDPNRKKKQIKDGVEKDVWIYTRIFTEIEGTHLAGYERRIYYDAKNKVYRSYYVPR